MTLRLTQIFGLAVCAWSACPIARGESPEPERWHGYLHLNGYTYHFAAPGTNDKLYGTGLTWYAKSWGRFQTAWETDVFLDSASKISGYAGQSFTLPWRFGSLGATGAVMYHRNFVAQNPYRVLPVVLPFAETTLFRRTRIRAYYVPPVRNRCDQQVAVQLLIPFAR